MKKRWNMKTFLGIWIGIIILQLLPFLFIGKWWGMILYYITFPFAEIAEEIADDLIGTVACAVFASSLVWALIFWGILIAIQRIKTPNAKKHPPAE